MTSSAPLQLLLDQLSRGDAEAARRAFVTYEPYLRLIVRRQLSVAMRARFDSLDVVQSVWADLLVGFRSGNWHFDSPNQLRAFLVRATVNRLIDRVRRERKSLSYEQPVDPEELSLAPETVQPVVGANLEAQELWQQMVALCPLEHRELLELKREGKTLAEIATHTGLHESSVRRILYNLAARLATRES
jgi:RNA polymerase sigma-70 factor (ECF subfamily)